MRSLETLQHTKRVTSRTIQLTEPGQFQQKSIERTLGENEIIVKPETISVCHADLRYFTGKRKKAALDKKLPMALFHEGIGTVVNNNHSSFDLNDRVVIVPNIPGYLLKNIKKEDCCSSCQKGLSDNYCENGVFMGSGYDGMAQEFLVIPQECAVRIPDDVPLNTAVLAELCTVSYHAITRSGSDLKNTHVSVFGDGPVGYLTAAMLHYVFNVPTERLRVFGAVPEKLANFTFAEQHLVHGYDFSNAPKTDIAIECAGGPFSESAANQAIDLMGRGGTLVLMGVSEERVPLNTRDILEKGLAVFGSSRSSTSDFEAVIEAMRSEPYQHVLNKLLPEKNQSVFNASDLTEVMQEVVENKDWKKTFVDFQW